MKRLDQVLQRLSKGPRWRGLIQSACSLFRCLWYQWSSLSEYHRRSSQSRWWVPGPSLSRFRSKLFQSLGIYCKLLCQSVQKWWLSYGGSWWTTGKWKTYCQPRVCRSDPLRPQRTSLRGRHDTHCSRCAPPLRWYHLCRAVRTAATRSNFLLASQSLLGPRFGTTSCKLGWPSEEVLRL